MDTLVKELDAKLRTWKPQIAAEVRERIAEIIELADADALEVPFSRASQLEQLESLDEPTTR